MEPVGLNTLLHPTERPGQGCLPTTIQSRKGSPVGLFWEVIVLPLAMVHSSTRAITLLLGMSNYCYLLGQVSSRCLLARC